LFFEAVHLRHATAAIRDSANSTLSPPFLPVPRRSWWQRLQAKLNLSAIAKMNPVLSSVVVIAVATMLLIAIWQRSLPAVTASEFFQRAITSDSDTSKNILSGVVYQKLQIRTTKGTIERAVYRDVACRRRPRRQKLESEAAQLETKLAIAGVGLDDPLSALSFQIWHDRQDRAGDEIKRSGNGLLTLRTTVSGGVVAGESLTVRESSFHPVGRRIEFLDSGVVEISELSYAVLGWDAVNDALFEPLLGTAPVVSASEHSSVVSATPRVIKLSKAQLDEAELQARLTLNQLQADSTGRIEVSRNSTGVQVNGIVATEDQKRELQEHLGALANVTPSIWSFQEAANHSTADYVTGESGISRIQAESVVAQASPLEKYLTGQGRNSDDINRLSRQFFNASLTVVQEGNALSDLVKRFAAEDALTDKAATALNELVRSHSEKLLAALEDQEKIFAGAGILLPSVKPSPSTPRNIDFMVSTTERNLALSKELTTGTDAQSRPAQSIIPELTETIRQLHEATLQIRSSPHDSLNSSDHP
jgi:hypothetical protein